MTLNSRNLKNVKFNSINGIKKKISIGTLMLTTGLAILLPINANAEEDISYSNEITLLFGEDTLVEKCEKDLEKVKEEYEEQQEFQRKKNEKIAEEI